MPSLSGTPDILLTETLWDGFYREGVSTTIFKDLANLSVSSVEVMTHPAYLDEQLLEISSYTDQREKELSILTNLDVPDWVILL